MRFKNVCVRAERKYEALSMFNTIELQMPEHSNININASQMFLAYKERNGHANEYRLVESTTINA